MVSGFLTSPCDHSRIFSGDASEMRMAENESGSFGFSKKLKMSFMVIASHSRGGSWSLYLLGYVGYGGCPTRPSLGRHFPSHLLDGGFLLPRSIRIFDE